jgi:hypothetical protein
MRLTRKGLKEDILILEEQNAILHARVAEVEHYGGVLRKTNASLREFIENNNQSFGRFGPEDIPEVVRVVLDQLMNQLKARQ